MISLLKSLPGKGEKPEFTGERQERTMTKYTLSGLTAEELQAIQEAAPELRIETGEGGIPVSFRRKGRAWVSAAPAVCARSATIPAMR